MAARPCLEHWAATMLARVRYPGDPAVRDALAALARGAPGLVREVARASLEATAAPGTGGGR